MNNIWIEYWYISFSVCFLAVLAFFTFYKRFVDLITPKYEIKNLVDEIKDEALVIQKINLANVKVLINYTNWRGKTRERNILPNKLIFGSNKWHKEEQWLLVAYDIDKKDWRSFAMFGINSWKISERVE